MTECLPYRPCVGIALFNSNGEIFLGERVDTPDAWQMPQGGVDKGETVVQAALRELDEEIGTKEVSVLEAPEETLCYDLPKHLKGKLWNGKYCGQEQNWVAARFNGQDNEIDLEAHDMPEFRQWAWVPVNRALELIVPFKKDVYERVLDWFSRYADPETLQQSPELCRKGSSSCDNYAAETV